MMAIIIIIFLNFMHAITCEERAVYTFLFQNQTYEPNVRPRSDSMETVAIGIEFELNLIAMLDERNQVLHTTGFIVVVWDDEFLAWNSTAYKNVKSIVLPPHNIWLPDFGFSNSADTFYHRSFTKDFRVQIEQTGRVTWSFGGNFATSCGLDLTYFPFDSQRCDFILENWAYNSQQVDLFNRTDHIFLDNYQPSGEWTICHTNIVKSYTYHDIHPNKAYPQLVFEMYLKRKPAFFILNIITPCSFIIVMAMVLFWLPAESGEKVSLGITVLLAFSVFQLVLADAVPKTSDYQPVLSIFVVYVMGMSGVSTGIAVFVLYLHHRTTGPVPSPLKTVFFRVLAPLLLMKNQVPTVKENRGQTGSDFKTTGSKLTQTGNDVMKAGVRKSQKINKCWLGKGKEPPIESELRDDQKDKGEFNPVNSTLLDDFGERNDGTSPLSISAEVSVEDLEMPRTCDLLKEILKNLRTIVGRSIRQDRAKAAIEEWRALARVFDRLMFFICSILIFVVSVYLFQGTGNMIHC